jgi:hypothetical protein
MRAPVIEIADILGQDLLQMALITSGVSNIGYIWRLEERSYEAWIVL